MTQAPSGTLMLASAGIACQPPAARCQTQEAFIDRTGGGYD